MEHPSFQSFVTTERWEGLGTTREALTAWVGAQDQGLADGIERAWREEVPAANAVGSNQHGSRVTGCTQDSDTADAILSRLKRDDPDLAGQVVRGETPRRARSLGRRAATWGGPDLSYEVGAGDAPRV